MSDTPKTWRSDRAIIWCALAVLLLVGGTIGGSTFSALRQRNTIEAIESASVHDLNAIHYDYELGKDFELTGAPPPGPEWLREWLGIDFFATARQATLVDANDEQIRLLTGLPGLRSIMFRGEGVTDTGMAELRNLPQLESVVLSSQDASDEGLAVLAELKHLRKLEIYECPRITDAGLEYISRITGLKTLELKENSGLTNAGLAHLNRLRNLELLSVDVSGPTAGAALDQLQSLPRLRHLELRYQDSATVAPGLRHLAGFASLEKLELSGPNQPADEALAELPMLPGIKTLTLSHCDALTAAGLTHLERFPNLDALVLVNLPGLDDAGLALIARLPKLRVLVIDGAASRFAAAGMESLGGISSLRVLGLYGCDNLTEEGLKPLARLKDLEKLWLMDCRPGEFSSEVLEDLKKSLPHCEIEYHEGR